MLEFSSDLFHYKVNLGILEANLATLTLDKDVDGFTNQRGYEPYPVEFNVRSEKTGKVVFYKVFERLFNNRGKLYGIFYRAPLANGYYDGARDEHPQLYIYDGRD